MGWGAEFGQNIRINPVELKPTGIELKLKDSFHNKKKSGISNRSVLSFEPFHQSHNL